jgi:hypothetical protein
MSSPWRQQTGPNQWYSVSHPPSWLAEMQDATVSLQSPDQCGALTLSSFWSPGGNEPPPVERFIDLDQLFLKRRNVRKLRALSVGDESAGFDGEARIGKDSPWWQRLFRRTAWRRFRIWCVRCGPVYVLALYLQTGESDRELETVAGMILESLVFNERPAEPPQRFAERVLALARKKFPLLDCQPEADFQLRLGDSRINLFNFYRSYLNAPDQFESIVLPALTTVVQVQEWGSHQTQPELEMVRDRIMPMLYPIEVWKERFPQFAGIPWVGGLAVLFVVDERQAYWYVREDLRDKWELDDDGLHELALANLERYFEERPMEFTLAGSEDGPRLLVPSRPDAYNSARLLSPKFHTRLRDVLGPLFAVGVPSRDFLVAINLDSAEAVDQVRRKVEDDYAQMDHPLSDKLLLVTRDGVAEFLPAR